MPNPAPRPPPSVSASPVSAEQVIAVQVETIAQIFNSFDPSPFRSRDLNLDAEAHIIDWARELPPSAPLVLRIHLPRSEADAAETRGVDHALAHYFADRADVAGRDLAEHFRAAWRYLTIGLPVLAVCLTASQMIAPLLGAGTMSRIVEESLIIVGWVANWKWIEAVLYDWWPLKRRRDLFRRLAQARVDIVPG